MCTWKTKSRQILPAMQRYIPTRVQRSDSNTSKNWVMDGSVAWVLLLTYFWASSWRRQWRRRDSLLGEDGVDERDGLVVGSPETSRRENKELWWCRARKDARLDTGGIDGGLPFYGRKGAATIIQTTRGRGRWSNGGGNTRLDNGQPVRSRWRDRGRGKEMAERCHGVVWSWHW
jgi:hypothetical protein